MKILAIESAFRQRSVALCRVAEPSAVTVLGAAAGVSERGGPLASMVASVLADGAAGRSAVDRLLVGVGPGSAAGIRSTLAFAIGWGLAYDIPVMGYGSLWGVAVEYWLSGGRGRVWCLARSTRGQFYQQSFRLDDRVVGDSELALVGPDAVRARLSAGETCLSPEAETVWEPLIPTAGGSVGLPRVVLPTAASLAWLLAWNQGEAEAPLEPLNLVPTHFVKAPPPRQLP